MAGDAIVSLSVNVSSTVGDLDGAAARAETPGPVLLGPITRLIRDFLGTVFDTRGSVLGHPWADLSEATVRREGLHPPLEGPTDDLRASFVLGEPGGHATLESDYLLSVGSDLPVAEYMQHGTKRMPARPVVPDGDLPDAVKADIAEALRLWIEEGRL